MSENDKPGYREISEYYEHLIRTGELAAGARLETEEKLARRYGVTRTTVRRAFAVLVRKGLVMKRQGRGTFVASAENVKRRMLSPVLIAPYRTVDVLPGDPSTPMHPLRFRFGYLEAVVRALGVYARPFQICFIENDPVALDGLAETVRASRSVGIVAFDVDDAQTVDAMTSLGVPVVFVDAVTFGKPVNTVLAADREGSREATRYLLRTTGGPLVFVGPPSAQWDTGPNRERLEGFKEAHAEVGRDVSSDDIHVAEYISTSRGRSAAGWALARTPRPRGIVCSTDFLAIGILEELKKQHISVPREVSVIGFGNDFPFVSTEPTLSTVWVDRALMCQRGVEQLEACIQTPRTRPWTRHVPTRLLLRQSTIPTLSTGAF